MHLLASRDFCRDSESLGVDKLTKKISNVSDEWPDGDSSALLTLLETKGRIKSVQLIL